MEAIRFIVDTLLWLLTLAFVLRLLFQLVRADFRDPDGGCHRARDQLADPAACGGVLPPIGKIDTATVVAVLLIASARTAAMLALAGRRLRRSAGVRCASR